MHIMLGMNIRELSQVFFFMYSCMNSDHEIKHILHTALISLHLSFMYVIQTKCHLFPNKTIIYNNIIIVFARMNHL